MASFTTYEPGYRMRVYAPRSQQVDYFDEITLLTPRVGAVHSGTFLVSTFAEFTDGVGTWKPYMDLVRGRRGKIDPLEKKTDTGELAITLVDFRTTPGGSNAERWITAFLGDTKDVNQLLGCRVEVEETLDGPDGTWNMFFTGRINSVQLDNRLRWQIKLRDMAEDMEQDIFVGAPFGTSVKGGNVADYASASHLLPIGLPIDYGEAQAFQTEPGMTLLGACKATFSSDVPDDVPGGSWSVIMDPSSVANKGQLRPANKAWPNQTDFVVPSGSIFTGLILEDSFFPRNDNVRIHLRGETSGAEGEFVWNHTIMDDFRLLRLHALELTAIDPDESSTIQTDPNYVAFSSFTDGETVEVYVYADMEPNDTRPIIIDDVHVADLWRDILDGKFGYRWGPQNAARLPDNASLGDPRRKIEYDNSAFNSLKSNRPEARCRFFIPERAKMNEWIQKNLCEPYNIAYFFDENGQLVPVDLARPNSAPTTVTITDDDLAPDSPGWEQDVESAIVQVKTKVYLDFEIDLDTLWEMNPGESSVAVPACGLADRPMPLIVLDLGRVDIGDEKLEFDAKGYRAFYEEEDTESSQKRLRAVENRLVGVINDLREPFASGAQFITLTCRRTSGVGTGQTNNCFPGDWRVISESAIPDAVTGKRGGTRLGRCVERTENGAKLKLKFLDLGPNAVASPPTSEGELVLGSNSKHDVNWDLSPDTAGDFVEVQYAITDTATGTRPGENDSRWTQGNSLFLKGTQTVSVAGDGQLPSGSRIWARARTSNPADAGDGSDPPILPSAWVYPDVVTNEYEDTDAWPQPNAITISGIDGGLAEADWTNPGAAAGAKVEVSIVAGTCPQTFTRIDTLPPGSTHYDIRGLDVNTTYCFAVRYVDAFGAGGKGAKEEKEFTTLANKSQLPVIAEVIVVAGIDGGEV